MDKSRQQFEEFIKFHMDDAEINNKFETANNGLNYADQHVDLMWISWQASRESLINNLPESINCPTAPELIWLQVDPEPEEENKPEFPVNLRSDDVTWCANKIHPTDTLYIRADLIQK
ncbi:hypothetical protein [Proteus mirabilis]|uniref:hypothetical protein n=1 Tax=Proteus mirabilis TaxID=584 RepID=UPI00028331F9|nr:hypothetical protein [Proteus mirabilis]EKB01216.1 hypothetical protein HMPREF1311_00746 [Proteus mirabilis WGLW6]EKT9689511.1 hypothetical protein [Proteus mirabilis]MDF7161720.1 hypothetical protein [Proteus mirabilis]HCT7696038.1 hypothetical protein [Proteus mirabilis]HEK1205593.1 hypothetical protein [Proteus mirabilis]